MDQSSIKQLTIQIDRPLDGRNPAEFPVVESCAMREGSLCPSCGKQKLAYDGLLNLTCPDCGLVIGGSFT